MVSQNTDLVFSYTQCTANGETIKAAHHNELIEELIKIFNFGSRGSRTPSNEFNLQTQALPYIDTEGNESLPSDIINASNYSSALVSSPNFITLEKYNKILKSINQTLKPENSYAGPAF